MLCDSVENEERSLKGWKANLQGFAGVDAVNICQSFIRGHDSRIKLIAADADVTGVDRLSAGL